MTPKTIVNVLAGSVLLAAPALAEEAPRFRIVANGIYGSRSFAFSQSQSFTEFAESGSRSASFEADSKAGFDVGVRVRVLKAFGVGLSFTRVERDQTGGYQASFPHPFFFNRPRQASGDLPGASLTETAGHLDVFVMGSRGKLDFTAWGGVSRFRVRTTVLQGVNYSQAYPYDSVTITSTPTSSLEDKPTGFNVGAGLDFRLFSHVAVGAQVRYSQAKARFAPTLGSEIELDAGGVQAGGGIRLVF